MLLAHSIKGLFLTQAGHMTMWEILRMVMRNWDHIDTLADVYQTPPQGLAETLASGQRRRSDRRHCPEATESGQVRRVAPVTRAASVTAASRAVFDSSAVSVRSPALSRRPKASERRPSPTWGPS